jgi:hypothetical protein
LVRTLDKKLPKTVFVGMVKSDLKQLVPISRCQEQEAIDNIDTGRCVIVVDHHSLAHVAASSVSEIGRKSPSASQCSGGHPRAPMFRERSVLFQMRKGMWQI